MILNDEIVGFEGACKHHDYGRAMTVAEVPDGFDVNEFSAECHPIADKWSALRFEKQMAQIQYIDKIVAVPVQKNVEVPVIQKIQKIVEVLQIQYIDKVVDVPVQKNVEIPAIQKVQKTVEVPQVQYTDKIVDVPAVKQVHVPAIQEVQKIRKFCRFTSLTRLSMCLCRSSGSRRFRRSWRFRRSNTLTKLLACKSLVEKRKIGKLSLMPLLGHRES